MKIIQMKKMLSISMVLLFLSSCKKETNDQNTEPVIKESNIISVYKNPQNKVDALLANVYDSSSKTTTYFYGASNTNGVPKDIKSLILEKKGSDTLHHYILDSLNRVIIAYSSLKNGTKLNTIIKMSYATTADVVLVSFYSYNWETRLDTLKNQISYDYTNSFGIVTLGDDFTQPEKDDFVIEIEKLIKEIYTNKRIFGAAIFISAGVCVLSRSVCPIAAGFIMGSTILLKGQIAKGTELQTVQNPNVPQSPTTQFIPNPISSPQNKKPQYFVGNWKVTDDGSRTFNYHAIYDAPKRIGGGDYTYIWALDPCITCSIWKLGNWRYENNKLFLWYEWEIVSFDSDNRFKARFKLPDGTIGKTATWEKY